MSENRKKGIKHGETTTRLYQIWENMRQRCFNLKYNRYSDYGGRGISMCKSWDDFLVFKKWALENGYLDTLTIDRMDNDRGYEPNNCRWITNLEQQSNTRKNRVVEANGESLHVSEWARRLKTARCNILYHVNLGKSMQDVFNHFS